MCAVASIPEAMASLKACRDLHSARKIHACAAQQGMVLDLFVANALIAAYARFGSVEDARYLFFQGMLPVGAVDVVSWNSLISGYAAAGFGDMGLGTFFAMQERGFVPNARTLVAALKACGVCAEKKKDEENSSSRQARERGRSVRFKRKVELDSLKIAKRIEALAVMLGYESEIYVGNAMIDTFVKCGSLEDARRVFERMTNRSVISWTALMMGYVQVVGGGRLALDLFLRMESSGCKPNPRTYIATLKACTDLASSEEEDDDANDRGRSKLGTKMNSLENGMALHARLARDGYEGHVFVASALVDLYAKCGSVVDAERAFWRAHDRDLVLWNAMAMAYAQCGLGELALELLQRMHQVEKFAWNTRTFVSGLTACCDCAAREVGGSFNSPSSRSSGRTFKLRSLERGMALHSQLAKAGYESNVFVANTLIDLYTKCGNMDDAQRVFDRLDGNWSVVSWTALIQGYAQNGDGKTALELFQFFTRLEHCRPNARTLVAALKACAEQSLREDDEIIQGTVLKLHSLETAFALHAQAAQMRCDLERFVQNSLVDVYSKCGSMDDASRVFWKMKRRDLVSWNALILGYAQNGSSDRALELFEMMQAGDGLTPDGATFVAALKACTNFPAKDQDLGLKHGMEIHRHLAKLGWESETLVANTLVDMYAKCGSLSSARRAFDRIKNRDLVSWNAMISGYAQAGKGELALELFRRLLEDGSFVPDAVTFIAALKACGTLGALAAGREIHGEIPSDILERKQQLATCLIDFYGKCGSMDDAKNVFDALETKNSVAWNALLAGFTKQGDAARVVELFEKMVGANARPNSVTFLLMLTALSHAGAVDKAKEFLELMSSSKFEIAPGLDHYTCMVDLFGRANRLDEALETIRGMRLKADKTVWLTLLSACQKWSNARIGKLAFDAVIKLDGRESAAYVFLANTFAASMAER